MTIRNLTILAAAASLAACVPANTPDNPEDSSSESVAASSEPPTSSESSDATQTTSSEPAPPSSSSSSSNSVSSSSGTGEGVIFTEDFESGSNGAVPNGWETFTGYVPNQNNANQFVYVDSAQAHNGSKSLRVQGEAHAPNQIYKALPSNLDQLYVRAWFYMSHPIGNDPTDNHEHIMGIRANANSADPELRVGQGAGYLGFNVVPSDALSPPAPNGQKGGGQSTPVNAWYCVEFGLDRSVAYDEAYMWVDGVEVNSVQDSSDWHTGVSANWADGLLNYVFFGWHSFSGNSTEMWIDDIVVSSEPIGCN